MRVILHALAKSESHAFAICKVFWNMRLSSEPLHSSVYSMFLRKRWEEGLARMIGAGRIWI